MIQPPNCPVKSMRRVIQCSKPSDNMASSHFHFIHLCTPTQYVASGVSISHAQTGRASIWIQLSKAMRLAWIAKS